LQNLLLVIFILEASRRYAKWVTGNKKFLKNFLLPLKFFFILPI